MSSGVKAVLVLVGTVAFFLVPVIGPAASSAGNWLVQQALGVDDESEVQERKKPAYEASPALTRAVDCCASKCDLDWNYFQDRCTIEKRADAQCYKACEAPAEPEVPSVIDMPGKKKKKH